MPIYCYVFPVRFYYSETNTGGDVAFRHVERKLVCVFMVTVTFCCFRFGWTTKKDHFIVFTYLLLFLCCVFCSDVTWSLFVQKKERKKNSFQIMTKDIEAVSYFRSLLSFAYWTKSQKFNNMHTQVLLRCCLIFNFVQQSVSVT